MEWRKIGCDFESFVSIKSNDRRKEGLEKYRIVLDQKEFFLPSMQGMKRSQRNLGRLGRENYLKPWKEEK